MTERGIYQNGKLDFLRDVGEESGTMGLSESISEHFQTRYNLDVTHNIPQEDRIMGVSYVTDFTFDDYLSGVQILREEMEKYPPDYIRDCCDMVYLANDLKLRGKSVLGFVNRGNKNAFLNFGTTTQNLRRTIHHELFHLADNEEIEQGFSFRFGRHRYGLYRENIAINEEWREINREGDFSGYQGELFADYGVDEISGFAGPYGLKNAHEDRATVAELMMTEPLAAKQRGESDMILHEKMLRIARLFYERSGGRMGKRYFGDLMLGKVNEEYWE